MRRHSSTRQLRAETPASVLFEVVWTEMEFVRDLEAIETVRTFTSLTLMILTCHCRSGSDL